MCYRATMLEYTDKNSYVQGDVLNGRIPYFPMFSWVNEKGRKGIFKKQFQVVQLTFRRRNFLLNFSTPYI